MLRVHDNCDVPGFETVTTAGMLVVDPTRADLVAEPAGEMEIPGACTVI